VHIGDSAQPQSGSGGRTPDDSPVLDYGERNRSGQADDDTVAASSIGSMTSRPAGGDRALDRWM
jgi:hypothetical protein